MYSIVSTAIIHGIESVPISVEADVSDGMPMFEMVGFLSAEVREARERVRTALRNAGYILPAKRITINFSPANVRKSGSAFDLPVAVAILTAMGIVPSARLDGMLIIGEIRLNGRIQPVHGVLPIVARARESGMVSCMVPENNTSEAELVEGMQVIPAEDLEGVIRYLREGIVARCRKNNIPDVKTVLPDFSEIKGQQFVKRACEVAVSGRHNLLMIGPPGAGKTMIAKRIPGILPDMSAEERLELSKIYSVCGMFAEKQQLLGTRPFRSPHHSITQQGLAGGGCLPRPGEISLSHHGVLFLDELPEFRRETLEILRQPLEEQKVHLVRVNGTYEFPADFMLVCAMNPCKCGYFPDMNRCRCSRPMVERYLNKISLPLLDRIDICVEAKPLEYKELTQMQSGGETSDTIRKRVEAAYEVQQERFAGSGIRYNSRIPSALMKEYCHLSVKQEHDMEQIYRKLNLTARSYHKILKVARTIADLEQSREIKRKHLNEAVCMRSVDKKYWEG